jgi:hypothetical protein
VSKETEFLPQLQPAATTISTLPLVTKKATVVGVVEPRVVVKIPWSKLAKPEAKKASPPPPDESKASDTRLKRKRRHHRRRQVHGGDHGGHRRRRLNSQGDLYIEDDQEEEEEDVSSHVGRGGEDALPPPPPPTTYRITEKLPEHFKRALRTKGSLTLLGEAQGDEEEDSKEEEDARGLVCPPREREKRRGRRRRAVEAAAEGGGEDDGGESPLFALLDSPLPPAPTTLKLVQSKQKVYESRSPPEVKEERKSRGVERRRGSIEGADEEEEEVGGGEDGRKDAIDAGVDQAFGGRKKRRRRRKKRGKQLCDSPSSPKEEEEETETRRRREGGRNRGKKPSPEGSKLNPLKLIRRFMPGTHQEEYEIDDTDEGGRAVEGPLQLLEGGAATRGRRRWTHQLGQQRLHLVDLAEEEDRERAVAANMAAVGVTSYLKSRMPHLRVSAVPVVAVRRLTENDIAEATGGSGRSGGSGFRKMEDLSDDESSDEMSSDDDEEEEDVPPSKVFACDLLATMKSFADLSDPHSSLAEREGGHKASGESTWATAAARNAAVALALSTVEPLFGRSQQSSPPLRNGGGGGSAVCREVGFPSPPFRHFSLRKEGKEGEEGEEVEEGAAARLIDAGKRRRKQGPGKTLAGADKIPLCSAEEEYLFGKLQRWNLDEKSENFPSNDEGEEDRGKARKPPPPAAAADLNGGGGDGVGACSGGGSTAGGGVDGSISFAVMATNGAVMEEGKSLANEGGNAVGAAGALVALDGRRGNDDDVVLDLQSLGGHEDRQLEERGGGQETAGAVVGEDEQSDHRGLVTPDNGHDDDDVVAGSADGQTDRCDDIDKEKCASHAPPIRGDPMVNSTAATSAEDVDHVGHDDFSPDDLFDSIMASSEPSALPPPSTITTTSSSESAESRESAIRLGGHYAPLSMPILFADDGNVQDFSTLLLNAFDTAPPPPPSPPPPASSPGSSRENSSGEQRLNQKFPRENGGGNDVDDDVIAVANENSVAKASEVSQEEVVAPSAANDDAADEKTTPTTKDSDQGKKTTKTENDDDDEVLCLTPLPSSSSSPSTSSLSLAKKKSKHRDKSGMRKAKNSHAAETLNLPETPPPDEERRPGAARVRQEADADGVAWLHCRRTGCEFYTRKPWKMERHRRCHADDNANNNEAAANAPRVLVCPDCGEKFTSLARLLRHDRRQHTREQDYECKICEAEVTDINVHMRVSVSFCGAKRLS